MIEAILNGIRYGLTGGVTVGMFVLVCVVLFPVIMLSLGAVNGIMGIFTGGNSDE